MDRIGCKKPDERLENLEKRKMCLYCGGELKKPLWMKRMENQRFNCYICKRCNRKYRFRRPVY